MIYNLNKGVSEFMTHPFQSRTYLVKVLNYAGRMNLGDKITGSNSVYRLRDFLKAVNYVDEHKDDTRRREAVCFNALPVIPPKPPKKKGLFGRKKDSESTANFMGAAAAAPVFHADEEKCESISR